MPENPEHLAAVKAVLERLKHEGALEKKEGQELVIDPITKIYGISRHGIARTIVGERVARSGDRRQKAYLDWFSGIITDGDVTLESIRIQRERKEKTRDEG